MKIIADENIARLDVFHSLGHLVTVPGREITAEILKDADALLIRSITKVNEQMLQGSALQFIASATSGIDHVDTHFLQKQKIPFYYAPGCNARSVVEYVFSAIKLVSAQHDINWQECSVGIIGAGNIGGMLAQVLSTLGIQFSIYDPFLTSEFEFADKLVSFDEVIQQDILTIHTPLTTDSKFPSYHLFDESVIHNLSAGTILINAARGAVVDNAALLTRLESKKDLHCVLDAWEGEPTVNLDLLNSVDIGTPHIAGYSFDGKLKGTQMIYEAFCKTFSLEKVSMLEFDAKSQSGLQAQEYEILQDHLAMQASLNHKEPSAFFDYLRKSYPLRLEYNFEESYLA